VIATPDNEFAAVAEAIAALGGVERACRATLAPATVELCRRRVAMLLGNEAELDRATTTDADGDLGDELATLARWTSSPFIGPAERACLAFTEQFVIDVTQIDDTMVAAVAAHSSPADTYVFARWLQACEARQRVELLFRHDPSLAALCASAGATTTSGRP
jgi:alkylhydroperoxidase family enzyme